MAGRHYADDPRVDIRASRSVPSGSAMQPAAEPTGDQPVEEQQHIPAPRAPEPATTAAPALTERDEQILAFEAKWWKHAGAKEQAIRDTFDLSSTRYYQLLNALLDNPAALERDPVLIGRLRRLRSARARTRRR
ncbi:DUF3263 domain-containing protein [Actinoplanes oblitus]|uniref:DUF3263 domain-containing protein n=1 Tax=Actinoplanes oblitus TaxID=3040509 RepID=A0ABY8WSV2_9ACTN|nr:DUF3263 domain-containing protein [Actinoplanes oblitus]WIN00985.1 DUF3263 domain-containing protein [Actinoplanes oblitus]